MKINTVTLEDGKDYMIIYALEVNNNNYVVLANNEDDKDILVRKVILENGEEYLVTLDNKQEFDDVMVEVSKKINVNR